MVFVTQTSVNLNSVCFLAIDFTRSLPHRLLYWLVGAGRLMQCALCYLFMLGKVQQCSS